MPKTIAAAVVAMSLAGALSGTSVGAQVVTPSSPPATGKGQALSPLTLTGCVSQKPGVAGQYMFQEAEGVGQYRLNGKDVKKFAGQKVELVAGSGPKALSVKGGLWPAPNVAARGGDIDPAQESIARQPGGGGAGASPEFPEIRVARLKGVEGACQ